MKIECPTGEVRMLDKTADEVAMKMMEVLATELSGGGDGMDAVAMEPDFMPLVIALLAYNMVRGTAKSARDHHQDDTAAAHQLSCFYWDMNRYLSQALSKGLKDGIADLKA